MSTRTGRDRSRLENLSDAPCAPPESGNGTVQNMRPRGLLESRNLSIPTGLTYEVAHDIQVNAFSTKYINGTSERKCRISSVPLLDKHLPLISTHLIY